MTPKVESLLRGPEFDTGFMRYALEIANLGSERGEVPVGAVLVHEGVIIAESSNEVESTGDPTAHAEMILLQRGARLVGRHGLAECTLYVTLEPCVMCAGGLVGARLKRLCFGARDERFGACRSIYRVTDDPRLNHRLIVDEGVLAEESKRLLSDFFRDRRLQNRQDFV